MSISAELVKKLREMSGAPMLECKKALEATGGDLELAFAELRKRGQAAAAKKAGRVAAEGLIGVYIHQGAQIAVIAELNCESDFVARTDEFKELAHDIAMHICATDPKFIRREDVDAATIEAERAILREQAAASGKPAAVLEKMVEGRLGKFYEENCLYEQHFIKDAAASQTIGELITTKIAKFGENIAVRRFSRFKVGEGVAKDTAAGSAA
ncbi:MAG: translation elongation factor Ts [Terriglobia bacterium]